MSGAFSRNDRWIFIYCEGGFHDEPRFSFLKFNRLVDSLPNFEYVYILREKSLAIYFEDSQFIRIRTFNFIVSKIYVDKRSRVR